MRQMEGERRGVRVRDTEERERGEIGISFSEVNVILQMNLQSSPSRGQSHLTAVIGFNVPAEVFAFILTLPVTRQHLEALISND